ncbi:MAG: type II toxin-antitoxin system YafQ family toxin [Patescibacteria group bacterium]
MYRAAPSSLFRRQVKRLRRSGRHDIERLEQVIHALASQEIVTQIYRDHPLHGKLEGYRECHIAPDWLLIYRIHHAFCLVELVSTGNHRELFGG